MSHASYFEVAVKDHRELGLALGQRFGENLRQELDKRADSPDWTAQIAAGMSYLTFTEIAFPQYIQELKGYAEGAVVPFEALWAWSLEDELWGVTAEKCTSVVTNRGKLIGHTEDWLAESQNDLWVLKKTVGGFTMLELYYQHTLGGQSAGVNSHGYVQLVSTMQHGGGQIGIPRNVVARWLAETADPAGDLEKLSKLRRSLGYSHTLVSAAGELWGVECTAKEQMVTRPKIPYVHTNHYLTELRREEANDGSTGTRERYADAMAKIRERMSAEELTELLSDQSRGPVVSLFNERTIGRVVFDLDKKIVRIWLRREAEKGWIDYKLDFI